MGLNGTMDVRKELGPKGLLTQDHIHISTMCREEICLGILSFNRIDLYEERNLHLN